MLRYFLQGAGGPPGPPHRFEGAGGLRPAACRHCRSLVSAALHARAHPRTPVHTHARPRTPTHAPPPLRGRRGAAPGRLPPLPQPGERRLARPRTPTHACAHPRTPTHTHARPPTASRAPGGCARPPAATAAAW
ncbi:uncharacterized protein LOC134154239 [Rhea pennata]|uniref:uncharacterized protein LOC134154239 n=1 Tax=Rhea pennata TaxID=8795 RepID=UPI002E275408